MGLLDRILGRKGAPEIPPEPTAPRMVTVKRPGGTVETHPVEDDRTTFDEWVADMKAKSAGSTGSRVKKATLDLDGLRVLDLRELEATRLRIVGSAYWVSDAQRETFGGTEYLLVREPTNRHDPSAVAVYGHRRKVGYLSAAKAAALAPILDGLPFDAFTVGGTSVLGNSIRLWVDVPKVPALRALASRVARRII